VALNEDYKMITIDKGETLNPLMWDPDALANYKSLIRRLPPLKKEQLDERIGVLKEWPPAKWFELRDRVDGTVTFQLETDQFAKVLGRFEDGVVYITHVELRTKGGK
jgi:hypothetical protein